MTSDEAYSKGLAELRANLIRLKPGQAAYDEIVAPRDQVIAKYQPIFSPHHIPTLLKDEFTSFLYFENNHHWSNLYRQGLGAASDMDALRASLAILLDENKPLRERFPQALEMLNGFGKAIATAILTVAYPEKYGVWNSTSVKGLRQVGIWPNFERGAGDGGRYEKINGLLLRLSSDLKIDLWTLDSLWWILVEPGRLPQTKVITNSDVVKSRLRAEEADDQGSDEDDYCPDAVDRRELVKRQIRARRGQQRFRDALRVRYRDKCVVTGCGIVDILEAAHISPYRGDKDNDPVNGLLLRADIHTLFDLDLLGIEPAELRIEVHSTIIEEYGYLAGNSIRCKGDARPSKKALESRYELFCERRA